MLRALRVVAAGTAICAALAGCTAPESAGPSEWIAFSGRAYQLESRPDRNVQDALGASIGGGVDLNADRIALAFEVEGAWSQHDVVSGGEEFSNDFDVLRLSAGLRGHSRLERAPFGLYVRGGVEWRSEDSDSGTRIGRDELTTYAGCGAEWWYTPFAALGPDVSWSFDDDGTLLESRVGLAVRFY
jgi:hypothetical protein